MALPRGMLHGQMAEETQGLPSAACRCIQHTGLFWLLDPRRTPFLQSQLLTMHIHIRTIIYIQQLYK